MARRSPGERGPLRIPKHLSAVQDAGAPDTLADIVDPVRPERPHGFPDNAELNAQWDALTDVLDNAGLLSRVDGPALELALRHFLAARHASNELLGGEVVVDDFNHNGGKKKNPAGAEFRAQSDMYLKYASQLGLTFAARARIVPHAPAPPGTGDGGNGDENPFAV